MPYCISSISLTEKSSSITKSVFVFPCFLVQMYHEYRNLLYFFVSPPLVLFGIYDLENSAPDTGHWQLQSICTFQ